MLIQQSATQDLKYPFVKDRALTVAGEVTVVLPEMHKWQLQLNGQVILDGDVEGAISPSILKHVRRRVPPFDGVIVLHQVEGSYCNGGMFRFLGLGRNGSFELSKGVGECFAREPVVSAGRGYVRVTVRGGYGNNPIPGEPYLPGGTWLYQRGRVLKVKSTSGKRPAPKS
jgi:hypothetical protein